MDDIDDRKINGIAEAIGDCQKIWNLGLNLGCTSTQISMYTKSNRVDGEVTCNGTRKMLYDWKKRTPKRKRRGNLKSALVNAELTGIADDHLGSGEDELAD